MDIVYEIDVTPAQHKAIEVLRNRSFPHHQVKRSYFKQLPHMRALQYEQEQLIGYLGLDYRVIKVGNEAYKILGIIDFCIDEDYQNQGFGSSMLSEVAAFAETKDVDFVILMSDLHDFYITQGYTQTKGIHSWLRIDEHSNYGVAVESVDELYIKSISGKTWAGGHVDWLGYMF